MKIELTIDFKVKWVLEHRADQTLPVANVLEMINGEYDIAKVRESSFSCAAVLLESEDDAQAVNEALTNGLKALYDLNSLDGVATVNARVLSDEEFDALLKAEPTEDERSSEDDAESEAAAADESKAEGAEEAPKSGVSEEIRRMIERRRAQAEGKPAPTYGDPEQVRVLLSAVDRIAGSSEFKALCHEIAEVAPVLIANNTAHVFNARSYLFVAGDGCDLEHDLDLLAKLINETGIRKLAAHPVVECALGPVKDSEEPFENVNRLLRMSEMASLPQILSIDICEWLNATDNRYFKAFLRSVAKQSTYIPVFRVPYVDKFVQDKIYNAINDVLFVKRVVIPPYTHKELAQYAKRSFELYGYTLNKAAWQAFFERLDDERADGKFYGLETVRKVVTELMYNKQLADAKLMAKNKKPSKTIGEKVAETIRTGSGIGEYGADALKKLVGSAEIEKRVNEIIAQIELAVKTGKERPCIHMQFVGNPGTGKTTVARIVGRMLKERGILSVGNFFEHAGRDFCGRYIGETAPKTSGMCRDAYGSVMFIDEAYSLFRGDGSDRDFGREALDTLIAEMENHRSDFVVIMAGYTDDMKTMMEGNAGLRSRVPYTIEFPNFTREQLYEIFVSMVGKLECEAAVLECAKKYFDGLPDAVLESKDFSNARFVRNLFERTWAKASMRCQLEGKDDVALVRDDFERAIADGEFKFDDNKQIKIGFRI